MEETKKKSRILATLIMIAIIMTALLVWMGYRYIHHSSPQSTTGPVKTTAVPEPKVQLALFATGLSSPTAIVSTKQANDQRLFVLDQAGVIRIVDQAGSVATSPFLDISSIVHNEGEMGLLGLVFSPHYTQDGYFFVNYIDKNQNTIIARYHASADSNKADPSSAQIVLTLKQPYPNHNGGDLAFGPDGYLYIALGDGGSGGDPQNRAQDLNNLLGKILRLDVGQLPYKIPPTNPFVNQAGKAGEIWDYGLRNPWRISFDINTHELYIADVGQNKIEEIDVEAAGNKGGNNYGWRCFEGDKDYNISGCSGREQYVFPVIEYDHNDNRCSLTGGYVYRGKRYQALNGQYFYGDFCNGELFAAKKENNQWHAVSVKQTPYKISTFGEDNQGELYVADYDTGSVYQLQNSN